MLKLARVGVSWSSLLAMVGAVPLAGGTFDNGVGGGPVITETQDELYIDTVANLWTNNNYEVPVCWHPLTTASQAGKDAFQQIVRSQWEANTGLTFTGFI